MANSATIALKIDLAAFGEGLKTALSMGKIFGDQLNAALAGKAKIDTKALDGELNKLADKLKKLDNTEIDIKTEAGVDGLKKLAAETTKTEQHTKTKIISIRDHFAMWGLAINGVSRAYQIAGRAIGALTRPLLEAEAASSALEASLQGTGIYSKELMNELRNNAQALQAVTKYEDDAIISNTALMQNIGRLAAYDLSRAQKAAIGLATMTRRDIGVAFELMGKAAAGSFAMLGKYGIMLDSTGSQQEKFSQLMDIGISKFPLAVAEAKTGAGALEQFKNIWGDTMESVGTTFVPLLVGFAKLIQPIVLAFGKMGSITQALIVLLPILTISWYKLTAAGVALGLSTGTIVAGLTAARVAVQAFLRSIGPIGWALMGLSVVVTAVGFALAGAKKDTDKLGESMSNIAAEAAGDLVKFDRLSNTVLTLGNKINRTAEETTIYQAAIKDLQANYGPHLKSLDLEKAKYQDIAKALEQVRGGLVAKMQATIQAKALEEFDDELVYLYRKMAELKRKYQPGDNIAAWGSYETALKRIEDGIKYYQDKALDLASSIKVPEAPKAPEGSEASTAVAEAVSDLDRLKTELAQYLMDADAKLSAEYARRAELIKKETVKGSAEQKKLMLDLDAWKRAEDDKLNDDRVKKMQVWLDAEMAQRNSYFDEMKFRDSSYYNWKTEQIRSEVEAMGLSGDRADALIQKRVAELDAEKAAWERLPIEAALEKYRAFQSEMSDSKTIGVAAWANIRDGLTQLRDKLLQFGDDPEVQKVLKQISGEIEVAQLNAGPKKGNWFWSGILGFDPENEEDQKRMNAAKSSLAGLQSQGSALVSSALSLNEQRKQKELERIEKVAEAEKWSNERTLKAKQEITRKYEKEERKLKRVQKAMAIGQAIINTAEAVTKALTAGPVLGPILAAAMGVMGGAQIAIISQQEFADGGYTGDGDKHQVAGTVHKGEVVLEKSIVRPQLKEILSLRRLMQMGYRLTDLVPAINLGMMPVPRPAVQYAYSGGGYVSGGIPSGGSGYNELLREMREINAGLRNMKMKATMNIGRRELSLEAEKGGRERRST